MGFIWGFYGVFDIVSDFGSWWYTIHEYIVLRGVYGIFMVSFITFVYSLSAPWWVTYIRNLWTRSCYVRDVFLKSNRHSYFSSVIFWPINDVIANSNGTAFLHYSRLNTAYYLGSRSAGSRMIGGKYNDRREVWIDRWVHEKGLHRQRRRRKRPMLSLTMPALFLTMALCCYSER